MNENCVLIAKLIDHYTDLQYILAAQDPVKETEYQLKVIRTKLEAMKKKEEEVVEEQNSTKGYLLQIKAKLINKTIENLIKIQPR